jgi:acetyl esterase/lipase
MKKLVLLMVSILIAYTTAYTQEIIPLYADSIPNSLPYKMKEQKLIWDGQFGGYKSISIPTLECYFPTKETATGSAVIICPGGGYYVEAYREEGINIAQTFIKHGIAAFILKYRLPSDSIMKNKAIGPLQDAQQAIKLVRGNAPGWNIDLDKIGIMGFSAGGHLASSAGTHFTECLVPNPQKTSVRPDFMILIYPVISMSDQLTHTSSRRYLLGKNPSPEMIDFFSNELHVTDQTPPTYLTHTGDDKTVDVNNSIVFYQALNKHKIPAEMHLYPTGDHGFVLPIPTEQWMHPVFNWMMSNHWTK